MKSKVAAIVLVWVSSMGALAGENNSSNNNTCTGNCREFSTNDRKPTSLNPQSVSTVDKENDDNQPIPTTVTIPSNTNTIPSNTNTTPTRQTIDVQ